MDDHLTMNAWMVKRRLEIANEIDALIADEKITRAELFGRSIAGVIFIGIDSIGRTGLVAWRVLNLFNFISDNSIGTRGKLLLSAVVRLAILPVDAVAFAALGVIGMFPHCKNLSARGFHYYWLKEAQFDRWEAQLDEDSWADAEIVLTDYRSEYYRTYT